MKPITRVFILAVLFVFAFAASNVRAESNELQSASVESLHTAQLVISGDVMDKENRETLAGAAIHIDGKKVYSDLDGHFVLPVSKPGKYQMKIELISYETTEMQVEVSRNENLAITLAQK